MKRTTNIEELYLKIRCPHCVKKIKLTFNTTKCPKCGIHFEENEIKQFYFDCESMIVNNKVLLFVYRHPKFLGLTAGIITGLIINAIIYF